MRQQQKKCDEKDEQIKFLQLTISQERDKLSRQIDDATNLVSRTKAFILSLKKEKQRNENKAQKYFVDLQNLQKENSLLQHQVEKLGKELLYQSDFKERFWRLNQENDQKSQIFHEESEKLQSLLKQESLKSESFMKENENLRNEFHTSKTLFEQDKLFMENEIKSLRLVVKKN